LQKKKKKILHTKRSVVWEFFKSTESGSVQCQLCRTYMLKQVRGSTTNMLKHVRTKHPAAVSQRIDSMTDVPYITVLSSLVVEVSLDDGDSDTVHSLSETASNGVLQSLAGDSSGIIQRVVVTNCSPTGRKRSLIWNYFERLTEAGAACCHICSKQLQFSENSSTSNLRRHILKRHPKVFSELTASMQQPPRVKTPRDPIISMDTEESFNTTEQIQPSGDVCPCFLSGARRVLRREQELIEALRRTQKEEARTLEHQRELLHKLRTAHAREVAAEKEGIELLRKTQQKEAEDLRRQREELKKEKEDLLRKWEEFREASKTILLKKKCWKN
uniref:Uncharacterized LOC115388566 n=1 Tax=Salarias fasciatus TaxID=181472 RepID=A0A672HY50_SALFA